MIHDNILNQDRHVLSSVIFGRGRTHPGVLFDTKPSYAFDPRDKKAMSEFRELVW